MPTKLPLDCLYHDGSRPLLRLQECTVLPVNQIAEGHGLIQRQLPLRGRIEHHGTRLQAVADGFKQWQFNGNILSGTEGRGTIRFTGTSSSIFWTNTSENWFGFTAIYYVPEI